MLSLEHVHPFHSPELSESSIGIHIRPVINNSFREQLGVLYSCKPGGGGNKAVIHKEEGKRVEKNAMRVMEYLYSSPFASVTVCVPGVYEDF